MNRIPIDRERLEGFCGRHHVRRLALFGSVLRVDFSEDRALPDDPPP